MSIISYEDEGENIKENADKQPYNWMVDEKYYKTNCCNNSYKI